MEPEIKHINTKTKKVEMMEEEDDWVPDFKLESIGNLTNIDMTGKTLYITLTL